MSGAGKQKKSNAWSLISRRSDDSIFVLAINYLKPEDMALFLKMKDPMDPKDADEAYVVAYFCYYASVKPPMKCYELLDTMPEPVLKYMYSNLPICDKRVGLRELCEEARCSV